MNSISNCINLDMYYFESVPHRQKHVKMKFEHWRFQPFSGTVSMLKNRNLCKMGMMMTRKQEKETNGNNIIFFVNSISNCINLDMYCFESVYRQKYVKMKFEHWQFQLFFWYCVHTNESQFMPKWACLRYEDIEVHSGAQ